MIKITLTPYILLLSFLLLLFLILSVILMVRKMPKLNRAWYMVFVIEVLAVYGVPIFLNFLPTQNGIRTGYHGDFYGHITRATQIATEAKLPVDASFSPGTCRTYPLNTEILLAIGAIISRSDLFLSSKVSSLIIILCSVSSIYLISKLFSKNRLVFTFFLTVFVFFGGNLFWLRLIPVYSRILFTEGLSAQLAAPYWALHFRYDPDGHIVPEFFLFGYNKGFSVPIILLGIYMHLESLGRGDLRRSFLSGMLGTFLLGSYPYAFITYLLGILASPFLILGHPFKRSLAVSLKHVLTSALVGASTITYWGVFILKEMRSSIEYVPKLSLPTLPEIQVVASLLILLEMWGVFLLLMAIGFNKLRRHYWLLVWLCLFSLFYIVDPTWARDRLFAFVSIPIYLSSGIVLTEMVVEVYERIGSRSFSNTASSDLLPKLPMEKVLKVLVLFIVLSVTFTSFFSLAMYTAASFVSFHPFSEIRSAYWLNRYSSTTATILEPDFPGSETIIPIFSFRRVLVGPWPDEGRHRFLLRQRVYDGASPWTYYDDLARYGVDYVFIQGTQRKALDQVLVFPKFDLIYNNGCVMHFKI